MKITKSNYQYSFFFLTGTVLLLTLVQTGNRNQNGHCPMCGRQWDGSNSYTPQIPDQIPNPGKQWTESLSRVLAKERLSKAQYQKDAQKYNIRMPYQMVIPQEENHIEWISELYNAFGMQPPDSVPPLLQTSSAEDALSTALQLEEELIPLYESLVNSTGNDTLLQVIGDILYQTRMHRSMFEHALSMGGMR